MDEKSTLPGTYSEELSTAGAEPQQYAAMAVSAAAALGWSFTAAQPGMLIFTTHGIHNTLGVQITISLAGQTVLFESRQMNEYYAPKEPDEYCQLFKGAMAQLLKEGREQEKLKNPMTREGYAGLAISKTYLVTPLLIYINAAIFICMVVSGLSFLQPSTEGLLSWGGNFRPAVLDGQWWRLITHMFLHGGIMHLAMNMYALLYVGNFLEPLLGKFRLASAYILSGICGGVLSLVMHPYTVGVGASGAIFGLYGVFLALLSTSHIQKTARKTMLRSILFFVVYNLIAGIAGNTDNAAHIGGLLSGFAIGLVYFPGVKKQHSVARQQLTTALLTVAVAALSIVTLSALNNDMSRYVKKMQQADEIETLALKMHNNLSPDEPAEALALKKDSASRYWQEDLRLMQEIRKLELPATVKHKNGLIEEYYQVRSQQLDLKYALVTHDDPALQEKIDALENRVEEIKHELAIK